jgi:hypothetical protein
VSTISVPNLLTELALSSIVSNKETRKEWALGTQQKNAPVKTLICDKSDLQNLFKVDE